MKVVERPITPEEMAASRHRLVAQLRPLVRAYEQKYGVASAALRAALAEGRLQDTWETCNWAILAEALARAERVEAPQLE